MTSKSKKSKKNQKTVNTTRRGKKNGTPMISAGSMLSKAHSHKQPRSPSGGYAAMGMAKMGKRSSANDTAITGIPKRTTPLSLQSMREELTRRKQGQALKTRKHSTTKPPTKQNNHKKKAFNQNSGRPTFQFKIGLQVGTALGECYLQVQKLENSMDKLVTVSEDISDVLQYLYENNIGNQETNYQGQSNHFKNLQDAPHNPGNPLEEVSILNENLIEWQRDSIMRMQAMSISIRNLQTRLEELDEHHAQAQSQSMGRYGQNMGAVDEAYRTISELQNEMYKTKMQLQDKNLAIQRLKTRKKEEVTDEKLKVRQDHLERKEKELDHDAELIAQQSEELRKESKRLLAEREEVRKQNKRWQGMIEEVKEQKAKLDARDAEVNGNHQKLFTLHETLQEEKKKLHRKAKKIKSREKRLNQLRSSKNYVQPNFSQGSDYAESELTYFSDGDTAIESVNSISSNETEDRNFPKDMKTGAHLNLPQMNNF